MANIQKYDDPFDRIEAFYAGSTKLSDADKRIAEKWELAFALLQKHRNKKIAVAKLMAIEQQNGRNLSQAQAYRDMQAAEKVFLPLVKYSKELLRHVMIESAQRDLKRLEKRMGEQDGTNSTWIKLMDLKHKTEMRIIELSGISDDINDLPDFSKLEVHTYNIGIPEGTLAMMTKLANSGTVDVTKLMKNIAEDTEFKDVSNDTNQEPGI
jgi:hypothetical protein